MRYVLASSHSFAAGTDPDPFPTAAAAWMWAALDLASSDHGAADARQLADAEIMAAHATDTPERWRTFVSHDGIAFCVDPELTCGHELPAPDPSRASGGTGYAHTRAGEVLCYACADDRERAEVASASTFGAYVSGDGRTVTTWPGGALMTVTAHGYSSRAGFGHGLHYWQARTPDGRTWHGRNAGPGMSVTMRAHK